MKKSMSALLVAIAASATLAACNGSNNNNNNGFGQNCGAPPNNLEVLYPIPGTKRAPDTLSVIYVATNATLPGGNNYDFYLNASNTLLYPFTNTFNPVLHPQNIPNPHATPSYANPVYYSTTLGSPPGARNSILVQWNNSGSGCNPNFTVSTFTTK